MFQRAAVHSPPALPDQLWLWTLHALSSEKRGAQGWDPRGVGAVTARAAPSPRRRGGAPLQAQCLCRAGPNNCAFAGGCTRPAWPRALPGGPGSGSCALRTPRLPENRPLKLWWLPPAPAQGGLGAPSAPALDRDYPGLGNVQASEPNRLCQASGLVSLLKTYLGWLVAHAYNLSITERWEIERVTSHWATQEPGAQCSR